MDTDTGRVTPNRPVMRETFTEEDDVACFKRVDVVTDESGAASGREEGEFHGGVVVPVKSLAPLLLSTSVSEQNFDVEQGSTPANDAEGLSGGGFDAFALAAHGCLLHGEWHVAMWRARLVQK